MDNLLILGSQSPRRKEIMEFFSLPFVQIPSDFDENSISFTGDPKAYAISLAEAKAEALSHRFSDKTILTADTVVYFNGQIFNKPSDAEDAHAMLKALAGNWHAVITAVSIRRGSLKATDSSETKILFYPLTETQISLYHQSCYFLDKAGSYAVQNAGNIIIDKMDGCYYNVMGLPIAPLRNLLHKVGIDLWQHLKPF